MRASLVLLAAMVSVTYAVGQYYVPRSYYTIDSDGHETAPVPLRRLRRSAETGPRMLSDANASATANAHADARGGGNANANAKADANADSRYHGAGASRGLPSGYLSASSPNVVRVH